MKGFLPNSFTSPSNRPDLAGDPLSADEQQKLRRGCFVRLWVLGLFSTLLLGAMAFGGWHMFRRFPDSNPLSGLPMGPYYWWSKTGWPPWIVDPLVATSLAAYAGIVILSLIWARPRVIFPCGLALIAMVLFHFQGCSRSYEEAEAQLEENPRSILGKP